MKKIVLMMLFAIAILALFSGFFWLYEVKFKVSRADVSAYSFSVDNSYIFITPLKARANSQEKVRLTVFVLNNQGLGVAGKKVYVGMDQNLSIDTIQGLTDAYGKAFFDVSASKPGEYFMEVRVDDAALNQKAHVSFY